VAEILSECFAELRNLKFFVARRRSKKNFVLLDAEMRIKARIVWFLMQKLHVKLAINILLPKTFEFVSLGSASFSLFEFGMNEKPLKTTKVQLRSDVGHMASLA
jgi:hypothetical protein